MKRLILLVALCLIVGGVSAVYGGYANVTSFTYNITAGMGTQTNYQMKFILSNSSGISGYYNPDNIIYTNGTTRADWYDVNATDGSNNPIPFWIENNTQTSKNASAWVNVTSIAVGNTSNGKWYYGNASQSSSTMNLNTTFPFGDDFNSVSLDTTTNWGTPGSGTTAISNGVLNWTLAGGVGEESIISKSSVSGDNYTIMSRARYNTTITQHNTGISVRGNTNAKNQGLYMNDGSVIQLIETSITAGTTVFTPSVQGTWYILESTAQTGTLYGRVNNAAWVSWSRAALTGNFSLHSADNAGGIHISEYDWVVVRKYVPTEPTTSLYSTSGTGGVQSLIASFTQSSNPSSTGQAVTYTDTSTGSPTTWNWTLIGTSPTNTTQNAGYKYSTSGVYNIFLNVTNSTGSWSNTSQTHTVNNASGFTQQDIWQTGVYNQTFIITDATTGAPIPVVIISDDTSQTYTTTTGTGYLSQQAGLHVAYFASTGYGTRSLSYIVDSDATHTIQLTATGGNNQQQTWYTPHQVRFKVVDAYQNPLPLSTISMYYVSSSLPSTNVSWLQVAYGIPSSVVADMTNSGLAMVGTTGSDGYATFTMHGSLYYNVVVNNTALGISGYTKQVMPLDNEYILQIQQNPVIEMNQNNTLNKIQNTSLWVSFPNISYVRCGLNYTDTSGTTTDVKFRVWDGMNDSTYYSTDLGNPGTVQVQSWFDLPNIRGNRYYWNYSSTRTP